MIMKKLKKISVGDDARSRMHLTSKKIILITKRQSTLQKFRGRGSAGDHIINAVATTSLNTDFTLPNPVDSK